MGLSVLSVAGIVIIIAVCCSRGESKKHLESAKAEQVSLAQQLTQAKAAGKTQDVAAIEKKQQELTERIAKLTAWYARQGTCPGCGAGPGTGNGGDGGHGGDCRYA